MCKNHLTSEPPSHKNLYNNPLRLRSSKQTFPSARNNNKGKIKATYDKTDRVWSRLIRLLSKKGTFSLTTTYQRHLFPTKSTVDTYHAPPTSWRIGNLEKSVSVGRYCVVRKRQGKGSKKEGRNCVLYRRLFAEATTPTRSTDATINEKNVSVAAKQLQQIWSPLLGQVNWNLYLASHGWSSYACA